MKINTGYGLCLLLTALCLPAFSQGNVLTLDQAVQEAFKNSPQIRAHYAQIRKSQGAVNESKTIIQPKLNADIAHTRNEPAVSVTLPEMGTFVLTPHYGTAGKLTVVMPIDISKKYAYMTDLTKQQVQMDVLSLNSTVQELIYSVKKSYYGYLRAKEAQKVAQASVDSATARYKNTKAKYEAGSAPKFDVTRAEVEVANLQQVLISSRNTVTTAKSALNNAMGIDVSTDTQVQDVPVQVQQISYDTNTLTNDAYTKRPDILMANLAVDLGKNNLKLKKTGDKPSASITGIYNQPINTDGSSNPRGSWTAIASISMPVWDAGLTRAQVEQANADINKSEETLNQAKLGVALDVKIAVVNIQDSIERVTAASQNVSLAEEALRLANVRYDAGISTLVEVTDAESALTQSRFNYVNALYDYAQATADLERATFSQPEFNSFEQAGK